MIILLWFLWITDLILTGLLLFATVFKPYGKAMNETSWIGHVLAVVALVSMIASIVLYYKKHPVWHSLVIALVPFLVIYIWYLLDRSK